MKAGLDQPDKTANGTPAEVEHTKLSRDVYSLLAQANLLRIRGHWEEAVDQCLAALRLAPNSASTQSLLGDIYENQGRYDDAVRWYRLALDVDPRSAADRMKLERLERRLREKGADPPPAPATTEMPRATGRPVFGLREIFRNPETALRYGALLAAALVLLVVAFAYRQTTFQTLGLTTDQEVKSQPVVVPSPGAAASATAPVPAAHDTTEQTLLEALRASPALTTSGLSVSDVAADPRTAGIAITYGLLPGADGSASRDTVLRSALLVVQAAATAPGSPFAVTYSVRCLLLPNNGGANRNASLIFVGDIGRSSVPATGSGTTPLTTPQMQSLFANSWWSPQIMH